MVLKVAQYRTCWYSAHIIKQHLPRLGGTVIYSVIHSLFVHHPVPRTVFIQNWFLPIRTINKHLIINCKYIQWNKNITKLGLENKVGLKTVILGKQ